jgi:serine protease Do
LDGVAPDSAFIFDSTGDLVAFSVERRMPNSADQHRYRSDETDLVPAAEVTKLVAGLPGTGDASNTPVSEAEENKLAWLGAELQPLNQELARANGVSAQTRDGETGALVTYVHPESPAAKAGLAVGSVLLRLKVPDRPLPLEVRLLDDSYRAQAFPWERLDEVPAQYFDRIPSPWSPVENAFIRALTDLGFGTKYSLEYFADGKALSKELAVEAGPAHFDSAARYKSETLGITVRDLTYEVRRYLQRKADEPGVVVSKVEPGGRAGVAGVRPYELVTHVNDQPVNTVKDFETLAAASGELRLSMKRMAKGRIVTVKAAN